MASILAVDDSPSVLKMVEFALRTRGHEVTTATDGQAALESLERQRFDLLVLDINMPRLDGLSLLKLVRERDAWKDTPVLMLTTEGQDSDRDKAIALGATAYMMKPFRPNELLDRVSTMVGETP